MKIMVLNAQDLFLFMDKHDEKTPASEMTEHKWQLMSSSMFSNKSMDKTRLLAQTIMDADPDIVMMTEVGGPESLHNFSRYLLENKYLPMSLPSNSDRGIDLGYLVKSDIAFGVDIHTHIDFQLPFPALKFSRDVLRLDLIQDEQVKAIFLLVHIKSKLDMKRKDFEGRTRRVQEIEGLIKIYQDLLHFDVPILIGGDFNGLASEIETEEEFKGIYSQTDLKDVAFFAKIPEEERFSYVYFNRGGNRFVQQIDYLFLSEKYAHTVDPSGTGFLRYKHLNGSPMAIPSRMEQKSTLPSDHYPFLATFKGLC